MDEQTRSTDARSEATGAPKSGWPPATDPAGAIEQPPAPAVVGTLEPVAIGPAPTAPVAVVGSGRPGRRWLVAALIGLVVVAISATGLFALVGSPQSSVVANWSPSDAIAYLEVRGDLPGDQHQNLARFLSAFPGFADQSTLDSKLDQAFDRLISNASSGKHNWSSDIKPWFGGEVSLAVVQVPSMALGAMSMGNGPAPASPGMTSDFRMSDFRGLLVATQKDSAGATAWLDTIIGGNGSTQDYRGVSLRVFGATGGPSTAVAVTGDVVLAGDLASVKSAIDRNGSGGLGASSAFRDAMGSLSGDQVLREYVDSRSYLKAMLAATSSLGSASGCKIDPSLVDRMPAWAASGVRIEPDALIGTAVAPPVGGAASVSNHESRIAPKLPASTLAVLEAHDLGKGVTAGLATLGKECGIQAALKQIEDAASVFGGIDHLTGWIGDAAVVVAADGATPEGGLVIEPTDATAAASVGTELRNLIVAGSSGSGVKVSDEPYGDGTITTFDISTIARSSGSTTATLPITGPMEISYTVQRGLVIVGVGPAFVKSVLDVKAGSSLADQSRYHDALARVGTSNAGSVYVDLAAIRKLAEPAIAKTPDAANYSANIRPYLLPFDVLAGAEVVGATDTAKLVITVQKP